jgi:hypothetical protein
MTPASQRRAAVADKGTFVAWKGWISAIAISVAALPFCHAPFAANTPQIDQETISNDFVLRLVQMATRLRSVGVVDVTKIDGFFSSGTGKVLDYTFPDSDAESHRLLWAYFFKTSQIYFGNVKNARPIVGFYSPIADYWLMTSWDNATQPILVDSYLLAGESVRHAKLGDKHAIDSAPDWLRVSANVSPIASLQEFSALSARAFEKTYSWDASEVPKRIKTSAPSSSVQLRLRNRLAYFVQGIFSLRSDAQVASILARTLSALNEGDNLTILKQFDGPTDIDVGRVLGFPRELRQELQPVVVLRTPRTTFVLSSRQDNGRWFFVTSIDRSKADHPVLKAIAFVDVFAKAEGN